MNETKNETEHQLTRKETRNYVWATQHNLSRSFFWFSLPLSLSCWWWLWQMMSFTQAFYYFSCAFFSLMSLSCRAVVRIAFWIQIIKWFFFAPDIFVSVQAAISMSSSSPSSKYICVHILFACFMHWETMENGCEKLHGSDSKQNGRFNYSTNYKLICHYYVCSLFFYGRANFSFICIFDFC